MDDYCVLSFRHMLGDTVIYFDNKKIDDDIDPGTIFRNLGNPFKKLRFFWKIDPACNSELF